MAQQVKTLAVKLDSLSSLPGTHIVRKRNDSLGVPCDLQVHGGAFEVTGVDLDLGLVIAQLCLLISTKRPRLSN